ncbi:MAG: DUF89 domain-containing protein [Candidatus Aminicenantales bacterium]
MRVHPECYPCFFEQILKTVQIVQADRDAVLEVMRRFSQHLAGFREEATPAEVGREAYRLITEITGVTDPYARIKKICTQKALALLPRLEEWIAASPDRLHAAVQVAIAGNVIDFGITEDFDLDEDLKSLLTQELAVDHFPEFRERLESAEQVVYVADNAGEAVFDRPLIQEMGKPVIYVVREKPVINDAVRQDAVEAGIHEVAEILSSGTDAPGTIPRQSSEAFLKAYHSADLIISKGQGNYEGLSGTKRPVFFLLKAKCEPVAQSLGVRKGDLVLKMAGDA